MGAGHPGGDDYRHPPGRVHGLQIFCRPGDYRTGEALLGVSLTGWMENPRLLAFVGINGSPSVAKTGTITGLRGKPVRYLCMQSHRR